MSAQLPLGDLHSIPCTSGLSSRTASFSYAPTPTAQHLQANAALGATSHGPLEASLSGSFHPGLLASACGSNLGLGVLTSPVLIHSQSPDQFLKSPPGPIVSSSFGSTRHYQALQHHELPPLPPGLTSPRSGATVTLSDAVSVSDRQTTKSRTGSMRSGGGTRIKMAPLTSSNKVPPKTSSARNREHSHCTELILVSAILTTLSLMLVVLFMAHVLPAPKIFLKPAAAAAADQSGDGAIGSATYSSIGIHRFVYENELYLLGFGLLVIASLLSYGAQLRRARIANQKYLSEYISSDPARQGGAADEETAVIKSSHSESGGTLGSPSRSSSRLRKISLDAKIGAQAPVRLGATLVGVPSVSNGSVCGGSVSAATQQFSSAPAGQCHQGIVPVVHGLVSDADLEGGLGVGLQDHHSLH